MALQVRARSGFAAIGAALSLTLAPAIRTRAQAAPPGATVTDAQVVASMQKGIDYLLAKRTGDNWEGVDRSKGMPWDINTGGMTAIALYALLHAGESLQDDAAYHAKLNWRGPALAPSVAWLSKNVPTGTYTAGLQASALTLLPKLPGESGQQSQVALDACKWYLLLAMGGDGGYSYTYSVDKDQLPDAWQKYFLAAMQGDRTGPAHAALLQTALAEYARYGGPQLHLQKMMLDLQDKLKAAKDARDRARVEAEMKELDRFSHELPPHPDAAAEAKANLTQQMKDLEPLLQRNGNPAGLTKTDPATNKQVPMTRADLAERIESLRYHIKENQANLQKRFTPFGDLSNGQYGTLGAWALADDGMELPISYWQVQDRFWRNMQQSDGGWPYRAGEQTTQTMGVAGIASLFIAQEFVDTELQTVPKPDKNIEAGLAWLNQNFKPDPNPYYLYGVERVGLSSGLKFFGTTDWYKAGAAAAIKAQQADGSWTAGYPFSATDSTSYMLLFLARGRNAVVFNKLQYKGYWNARPRDDAYVTRWMSKRFEKPINWQVVNLQVSPEEWLDAPVLLITGSVDPKFTRDDIAKLRQFIEAGGMIFSTADANSMAFTSAIKKYAAEVVHGQYEMRTLPKNSELFSKELGADLPNPPLLFGLSNGAREIWIHSPQDLGADWQMRRFAKKTSFEIAAAVYFYASGMGSLRSKLQPLAVADPGTAPIRTIDVARIDYTGNFDPEPGAWPRMARLAKADFKTQVNLATVKFADLDAKKYALAHLTGTARVTWTPEQAAALKAYLDAGGMVLMDPAGGSAEFAASCQELIKQVYPDEALMPVPLDSPIVAGTMPDGAKITDTEFRKYGDLFLKRRVTAPMLEQVVTAGRTRILFSPWDIASGFLGTNTWGIVGYAPATSQALGRNILLYAQHPSAASQPATR